eukprot:CCRYP_011043-RA/>CCRYP_011043-RA protein AED:0.43 eAED:0.32 QI:0/-1/0/1/-1/0/1/0/80
MHQTVGNLLQLLLYNNPSQNLTQARDIIDQALATAMQAMSVTVASILCSMPGVLVLSHDMFLKVLLIVRVNRTVPQTVCQ